MSVFGEVFLDELFLQEYYYYLKQVSERTENDPLAL